MTRTYSVIDADGHVLEPPDLWVNYIEPRFRDRAPRMVKTPDGGEIMSLDGDLGIDFGHGKKVVRMGGFSSFGARETGVNPMTMSYLDGKRGGFDPHERIKDMDAEGIDAAFLYPSLGLTLGGIQDAELGAAAARAYNRWLADYCAPYPDRLFGSALLPMQSVDAALQELKFAVEELGFRSGFLRPNPYNGRMLHDPEYEPFWAAAEDMGIGIGLHGSGEGGQPQLAADRFREQSTAVKHMVVHTFEMMSAATSLLMCGVLDRHPKLRVAFLESGGGWMAGWLDRMDRHFDDAGMNDTGLTTRPSEIFKRQCFISFEPVEKSLVCLAEYIGPNRILWATDYPHSDGFPNAPQLIRELGLKSDVLDQVLADGALRFYGMKN